MKAAERLSALVSLAILALALGHIETAAVVYLREIHAQAILHEAATVAEGLRAPISSLLDRIVALEMAREGCTLLVLAAVAWVAGRRLAARAGAFLLTFGLWNLIYYASLRLVLGRPSSLRTWDILYFMPMPWVVPVWAAASVAAIFVVTGAYLFWTSERERRYRGFDISVLVASFLSTLLAFFIAWNAAADAGVPNPFPSLLFLGGVLIGIAWFVRVERRVVRKGWARA